MLRLACAAVALLLLASPVAARVFRVPPTRPPSP